MRFRTDGETGMAALMLVKWLAVLGHGIEAGVAAMGFGVEEKRIETSPDGTVNGVLRLRGRGGWAIELGLRNPLDEFLAVDRDEAPLRFDHKLLDAAYAERKLADICRGAPGHP